MNESLPLISKDASGSAVWIELRAALSDKLDWKEEIAAAQKHVEAGRKIFWELNLGLNAPLFSLEEELVFQGLIAALKHFSETVYTRFEESSLGLTLYRGPLDLCSGFLWSERQRENYAAWQEEHVDEPLSLQQFCLDSYSAYFQMLSSKLSDELPIFALFDASGLTRAEALLLLSKERFQHFELAAKGIGCASWCLGWEELCSPFGWIGEGGAPATLPEPHIGVSMPQKCSQETLISFEALLTRLDEAGILYRVMNEAFLTEQWEGLDTIIALSVEAWGKRKFVGFIAAGGEIVFVDTPLGLSEEVSLEEYRGRGIRTPDLLVPNQPR